MTFVLEQIERMEAYRPPLEMRANFSGLRLDFNERQAPLPELVAEAIKNFDPQRCLSYPAYGQLETKIAQYSADASENVMVTNGSDQGIELIFRTFIERGDQVVIPSPSFAMFYQVAAASGATIIRPEYLFDGSFPFREVLAKQPKLLIICNPNNPTGTLISAEKIEDILQRMPETLVYVDEAYFEFSGVTVAGLINQYSNLIITRTFSKAFGLAALRIGYVISCKENIEQMLKVRGPYDVNQMAKVAAEAALEAGVDDYVEEVMQVAKAMVEDFFRKKQIEFYPSGANFIYFKAPRADLVELLKAEGILVRPQNDDFIRVTIGQEKQMKQFIQSLTKIL